MGKWGKYLKRYNKEWEKDPLFKAWLTAASEEDVVNKGLQEAYCKVCHVHLRAHRNDLKKHREGAKHKQKIKSLQPSQTRLDNFAVVKVTDQAKAIDLKLAVFITIHCSVKTIDHLGELLKVIGKGSLLENLRLHRTKCSKLISAVIAPAFLTELIRDIGDSQYALIADEATDIAATKFLGMCVRYFSKRRKQFITDFLGIVEVTSCTGENLAGAVLEYLGVIGLPSLQMESIGVDGAPAMCGVNNSFYTHLKKVVPHLQLVKCICHSIDKAAEHAYKAIPDDVTFLVNESTNYFAHSSLRRSQYTSHYKARNLGKSPLELLPLSKTRWLIWCPVSSQFVDQWEDLKTFFEEKAKEKNETMAKVLAPMFTSSNLLYLTFLKTILKDVQKVNLAFERSETDITKLYADLRNLVFSTAARLLKPQAIAETNRPGVLRTDEVEIITRAFQDPSNYLHRDQLNLGDSFRTLAQQLAGSNAISDSPLKDVQQKCGEFLLKLGLELCSRLPPNLATIKKLKFLTPQLFLAKTARPNFDQLPLERAGPNVDQDTLESQWIALGNIPLSDICHHDDPDIKKISTEHFWGDVLDITDAAGEHPFEELARFAIRALTLPISNAVVERIFSLLNHFKSKRRNKLQMKMLDSLIRVRAHLKVYGLCCRDFEPTRGMLSRFNASMYLDDGKRVDAAAAPSTAEGEDPDGDLMEVDLDGFEDLEDEDYEETLTLFDADGTHSVTFLL